MTKQQSIGGDDYKKDDTPKTMDQGLQTDDTIYEENVVLEEVDDSPQKTIDKKILSFLQHILVFTKFPLVANVIILVELIERFAFYGFKSILVLYISTDLGFGDEVSKIVTHAFIVMAYFTPILGSAFADSKVGKFWTIFVLTLIYAVGEFIITGSAFFPKSTENDKQYVKLAIALVGLAFSGLGTGGIKPNVSTYGADQIPDDRLDLKTSFFSMFYFSINLGSTVSTILLPILKEQIGYGFAFLIPAVAIVVVALIFAVFKKKYRNRVIKDVMLFNVMAIVAIGVWSSIYNFFKAIFTCTWTQYIKGCIFCCCPSRRPTTAKPLPNVVDDVPAWTSRFNEQQIEEVKKVTKIAICMLFVPMFWALYDQHSSTWVLQAKKMNKHFFGYELPADLIQASNPIFILLLVPFFDRIIYPLCTKMKIKLTPMRKLGAGLVIILIAFSVSCAIEVAIALFVQEHGKDATPPLYLHMFMLLPQNFLLCVAEVLFSITGLDFAYAEAPDSLKSIVSSIWLLYISSGNLIVVFVSFAVVLPLESVLGIWDQVFSIIIYIVLTILNMGLFLFISKWWEEQKRYYETMKNSPTSSPDKELEDQTYQDLE